MKVRGCCPLLRLLQRWLFEISLFVFHHHKKWSGGLSTKGSERNKDCWTSNKSSTVWQWQGIQLWSYTESAWRARADSPCHILPNRMVQRSKKIAQLWKALALCFTPVDCRRNGGKKPVIPRYTYSTVLDLHQWKLTRLWNCGLDLMQLLVTCVFVGQTVTCTFTKRKGTSGTKKVICFDC